jgi:MFS superfamily sulfate permease-like transporter
MALSLLAHVRRGYRPKNSVLVADGHGGLRTVPVSRAGQLRPGLLVYRFNHSMYYANASQLAEQVQALAAGARPPLSWFCIDMAAVDDVDFSAGATLRELCRILGRQHIRLVFVEIEDDVRAELDRYGIAAHVGKDAFATTGELVRAYEARAAGGHFVRGLD